MQKRIRSYLHYAKELLILSLPLIMGNIGFIMIGAGDVYVAAKYSTNALASISIANSLTSVVFMFGIGLLISVSPILSNVRGQRKSAKKYFYPTIKFSILCATISMFAVFTLIPLIDKIGFAPELVPDIKSYIFIIAFSTFGGYLHAGLKEYLQAYEIVFFPNVITILSIFLNLALNIIFMFGFGPIPAMGVKGLAIASVLIRLFMGLSVYIYCIYYFSFKNVHTPKYYFSIIKLGLPISFAISIEFLALNGMTILLGRVSGLYAAAQNIIIIITSTAYMVPLAIANGIAVKVGFANGAKNIVSLKKYALVGTIICTVFMMFCGIICAIFGRTLATIFTDDLQLINIIVPVMILIAGFQIFDGLQVALGGIAKGIKKTKIIFVANLVGYWLFGFPTGVVLALKCQYYLGGFWAGFIVAPATICIILTLVLVKEYKKIKNDIKKFDKVKN